MTGSQPQRAISIVIATHNRSKLLRQCLESLDRQTAAAKDFEVIVVVDGGTDDTVEMLAGLTTRYALTTVVQPNAGPCAARNTGVARAAGGLLLFLDDDEEADAALVSAHLAADRSTERIVGIGLIKRRVPEGADRFAHIHADDSNSLIGQRLGREPTYWDCYGGNFSVARDVFVEVGGFATDLVRENDTELAYRLDRAGCEFVFVPDAIVSEYRTRPWHAIYADLELRGRIAVEFYSRYPAAISEMPLGRGAAWGTSRMTRLLSRSLLGLRVRPKALGVVGFLLPQHKAAAWFWFASNHAYWCGVRAAADRELWRRLTGGTVILGYHAFGPTDEPPSRYVVPKRRFSRQLWWLKSRRYNVMTLAEYAEHHAAGQLPPPKTVVITIDDGYVDTATIAGPLLERFGFRATLFLISLPGSPDDERADPILVKRPILDPVAARKTLPRCLEIGAHTQTHRNLATISPSAAEAEILGSKRQLEQVMGKTITTFAYPFGGSDPTVRMLVERAGFRAARGITPGRNYPATDLLDLRRIEIRGSDSLLRFAARLALSELHT